MRKVKFSSTFHTHAYANPTLKTQASCQYSSSVWVVAVSAIPSLKLVNFGAGVEHLPADLRVWLRAVWQGEGCGHQEAGVGSRCRSHRQDSTHTLQPGQVRRDVSHTHTHTHKHHYTHHTHLPLSLSFAFLRIIEVNGGQPPLTYKRFQTLVSTMDPPEAPLEPLSKAVMGSCITPVSEDHREKYGVPLLEELGG